MITWPEKSDIEYFNEQLVVAKQSNNANEIKRIEKILALLIETDKVCKEIENDAKSKKMVAMRNLEDGLTALVESENENVAQRQSN